MGDVVIAAGAAVPGARPRAADRVFQGALAWTSAFTLFWLYFVLIQPGGALIFTDYRIDRDSVQRVAVGFLFFSVLWGLIWYGVKTLLLRYFVGFTKDERRAAFSSRMNGGFDLSSLLGRYSERRIRIADMIGRRGRFIVIQLAGFAYLYGRIATEPTPKFLTMALQDNLFDAVVFNWATLALYYSDGFLSRAFFGAQTRVMDGLLGRANCLLIMMLWSAFKFVMVPIGAKLSVLFQPNTYAVLFVLIWGAYTAADTLSEIVGSLFGKQRIRVWGMGDINRKSIAGTVAGFLGALAVGLWAVLGNGLPMPWVALAVVVALSSTLLELFSPRGTDDFTIATGNALLCLAFGAFVL